MSVVTRTLTEFEESASGFLNLSFTEKDDCKQRLNDAHVSDAHFARGWIEEKVLTDFLRFTIEDKYIPMTPETHRNIERLRGALKTFRKTNVFDPSELTPLLSALRSLAQTGPARTLFAEINVGEPPLTFKGRIPQKLDELIPVSSKFYDFVPVLDDNLADPRYAPAIVNEFANRLERLRTDEKVKSLCFIEKDAGPVGALAMLAQLVSKTGMPASIYREPQWPKHSNFAGYKPQRGERVAFVYDLVVTGGGIRHAATALRDETGADPCVALVLFAYGDRKTPITGSGLSPLKIESLGWYEQERAQIQKAADHSRKLFGGASNAEGAKEGASSVEASLGPSAAEDKMSGKHSNGAGRHAYLDRMLAMAIGSRRQPGQRLTAIEMMWRGIQGRKIYQRLRSHLEREHKGEFVAIDLSTSKYVTALRFEDAAHLAAESFGDHPTWVTRVGEPMKVTAAA